MAKVSSDQWYDRCKDKSILKKQLFLGFVGSDSGANGKSKCKLFCKVSKEYWETTNATNHLHRDKCSCKGCSKRRRQKAFQTNEKDCITKLVDACTKRSSEFLGWAKSYHGITTKIKQRCLVHPNEKWDTTAARDLIEDRTYTSGCPECHKGKFKETIDGKSDLHIKEFLSTGVFPNGYIFSRSNRLTSAGVRNYWDCYCPLCNDTFVGFTGSLKKGCLPCDCNKTNKQGFYSGKVLEPDYLYILHFHNEQEEFIKIGRTFNLPSRLSNLPTKHYNIDTLYTCKRIHTVIYDLEQNLHECLKRLKHIPKLEFGGMYECFKVEVLNLLHPDMFDNV